MKALVGMILAGWMTVAQAATVKCVSTTDKGSYIRLDIKKGRVPASLEGSHRYNRGTSYVGLDCTKTSAIVASSVRYSCADATYGVNYAWLNLSPLAFQGSAKFPVKLTYLDESTGEPAGGTEVFACSK